MQGVSDEESRTSPWTYIAKYKLMVEEELSKLDGYEIKLVSQRVLLSKDYSLIAFFPIFSFRLNYVIVRPAVIYGLADRQGLSKLLCMIHVR